MSAENHDESDYIPLPELTEEDKNVQRVNAIRVFEVLKVDGTNETVIAHWHDTSSGTLYFITFSADGRKWIHHAYNARVWNELHEIHQAVGSVEGSRRIN